MQPQKASSGTHWLHPLVMFFYYQMRQVYPDESTAQNLLHALVIAIRDKDYHYHLLKLARCYPRLTNKSNAFISLCDEIKRLQSVADKQDEEITMLKRQLEYEQARKT